MRNNAKTSERITLLHKVSGYLLPGHLSALVSSLAPSITPLLTMARSTHVQGHVHMLYA